MSKDKVQQLAHMIAESIKAHAMWSGEYSADYGHIEVDGYVDCVEIAKLMIEELQ